MAARVWTLFDTIDLGIAADNVTSGQAADTIDFITYDAKNGDDYYFNTRRNVWHYDLSTKVVTGISGNNFDGGATPVINDITGLVWFNSNLWALVVNVGGTPEGYIMQWDGAGTTTWTQKTTFTTILGVPAGTPTQDKRKQQLGATAGTMGVSIGNVYTSADGVSFSSTSGVAPFGASMRTNITASISTDWTVNDAGGDFDFIWGYFKGELFGGDNVGGGASRMKRTANSGTTNTDLTDNPDYSAAASNDKGVNMSIIGTGAGAILFPAFKFNTSGGYDTNLAWVFDGTDFIQDGDMDGSTSLPTTYNKPHSYFLYGTKVICRTEALVGGGKYGYHLFEADANLPAGITYDLTHSASGIPGSII